MLARLGYLLYWLAVIAALGSGAYGSYWIFAILVLGGEGSVIGLFFVIFIFGGLALLIWGVGYWIRRISSGRKDFDPR